MNIVIIMNSQSELLQIVLALRSSGRFARLLNSREEQGDKNSDNRNDHKKFN